MPPHPAPRLGLSWVVDRDRGTPQRCPTRLVLSGWDILVDIRQRNIYQAISSAGTSRVCDASQTGRRRRPGRKADATSWSSATPPLRSRTDHQDGISVRAQAPGWHARRMRVRVRAHARADLPRRVAGMHGRVHAPTAARARLSAAATAHTPQRSAIRHARLDGSQPQAWGRPEI